MQSLRVIKGELDCPKLRKAVHSKRYMGRLSSFMAKDICIIWVFTRKEMGRLDPALW